MTLAQFGELLAELRQDLKMTQRDLADALYVSVSTISNYEKGVHYPDIEKLKMLADYFHVTTDYLLGRSSSKLSPDALDQVILDGKTVGDFIQELSAMSLERRQALALIINDMRWSMMIQQHSKNNREAL